jgi:hypothetical protein
MYTGIAFRSSFKPNIPRKIMESLTETLADRAKFYRLPLSVWLVADENHGGTIYRMSDDK